ncbi:Crp/Fnr family transcriptional regulator [Hydrogenophaga sp.]|uniref:Crp/Fnr family transcriptional regulator n=1 Tax=Hydrogenophaga sp. TaxID=1904254 RepID=UPI003D0CB4ED
MKHPTVRSAFTSAQPGNWRARCAHCATLQVCLMGCLPQSSRELLAPCIVETAFSKGDVLQAQDTVAQRISIIKVGALMATREDHEGQAHPVALLGRGKTLGQYAVYGHREQIGAQALSAGRVCSVDVPEFYRLGVVDRKFHACVQARIVCAHGQLADWSRVMRIKGLQQKLLATLQLYAREQASQAIRLPSHVALAALLSTTRETIARSLRQLEAAGHILRHDRWHCEVVRPAGHGAGVN